MADLIWRIEISKFNWICMKLGTLGVFRDTDFKLEVKLQKCKMAYLIWRTDMAKYKLICMKLGISEFFGPLIPNQD